MRRTLCIIIAMLFIFTAYPVQSLAKNNSDKTGYAKKIDLKSISNSKSITVSWSMDRRASSAIKGFDLYRKTNGGKSKYLKRIKVGKTSSKSSKKLNYKYYDSTPSSYAYVCDYEIWPFYRDKNGRKKYFDKCSGKTSASYVSNSLVSVKANKNSVTVKMQKLPNKPKYIIRYTKYKLFSNQNYSPQYHTTKKRTYVIKNVNTSAYGYIIDVMPSWKRTRPKKGASKNTHDFSTMFDNQTEYKAGKVDVINTQGKTSYIAWTYNVSSRDKQIIAAFFESVYHGKYPSKLEMARYALNWINKNVTYAYDYGSIESLSYVDAIFLRHKGQCLQYNGAFAAVLNYLGYKSRIIMGYRARGGVPSIQHFWCEAYVDGHWYVCETGNYGKNGNWKHFMKKYSEAKGYTKNGLPAKDS